MVPNFQSLMKPLLEIASEGEVKFGDAVDRLADELNLTESDRQERIPCGTPRFYNRVSRAKQCLKKAGLVEQTKRLHHFMTTGVGRSVLRSGDDINLKYLKRFEEPSTPPPHREEGEVDIQRKGFKINTILYGPPGTGKTFATFKRCVEICGGEAPEDKTEIRERYQELVEASRVEFVTFHQSYGYEEFVEGLRPVAAEGGSSIEVKDGVIKHIAERARNSHQPHVLVIDEINRANISKVMGELITLIEPDKREGQENEVQVTLPHSQKSFSLPDNLYILGTMNTADRSIALLDVALRRRFDFEEMLPNPDLLEHAKEKTGVDLSKVLDAINARLEYLIDRDHLIGHAWLMHIGSRDALDECMRRKIIPLIAEYFFEDWSKVRAVLGGGNGFLNQEKLESPKGVSDGIGDDRYRWRLRKNFEQSAYDELIGHSK